MFEQMLLPGGHTHQGRCAAFAFVGELGMLVAASLMVTWSAVAPLRMPETIAPLILSPPPPPPAAAPAPPRAPVKAAVMKLAPRAFTAPVLRKMPAHAMVIIDAEPVAPDLTEGGVLGGVPGGVPGGSLSGLVGSFAIPGPVIPASPPKPAVTPPASTAPTQIRVGGDVEAASLIHEVKPVYPSLAKRARIDGEVRFSATIAIDGTVKDLHFISGHPLLVEAAKAAVVQWVYRPTYLNGHPAEVLTDITVRFSLI